MMRLPAILCVALLLTVTVEGQLRVCQPGSVFRVDCNMCRCNNFGTDMACTRKACVNFGQEFRRPSRSGSRRFCRPGSYFKMDCNDCRCNADGTNAACTLKACL